MRVGPLRRERERRGIAIAIPPCFQLLFIAATWCLCAPPAKVAAQAVPANAPGTLLRRLADAADAFRTGTPIWIVAHPNPPHDISGIYDTQSAADADPSLTSGFVRYGPFITPLDAGVTRQSFGVCMHRRRPYSQWACPPEGQGLPISVDSVISIELTVNAANREPLGFTISPDSVDLVFFTLSAFDRFLAPYYTSAFGTAYTAAARDSVAAAIRR